MTKILFLLFLTLVSAENKRQPKTLPADPGCLNQLQLNLKILNERLEQCQKPTKQLPSANLEKLVEVLCEYLADDMKCYQTQYNSFKKCLLSDVAVKYYADKLHQFNAGRTHRCLNAKHIYRDFNSPKGENCIASTNETLQQCTKVNFTEPWTDLKTIDFPPEVEPGKKPKFEVNIKECRLKGMWLTCAISKLDSCKDRTAKTYYKGYYGAMLAASRCKRIIDTEFPSLIYTLPLPKSTSSIYGYKVFHLILSFIIVVLTD